MNYYNILKVGKDATSEEIKRNYKTLAIKYHPDKNQGKDTQNMFRKITGAYQTLNDPYKRGKYDAMLEQGANSDINTMFGMNFIDAMRSFNTIFANDSFFNVGSNFGNNFGLSRHDESKIPNRNSSFYSYSSSTISNGMPGKIKSRHEVKINRNGKHDQYKEEYYIDSKGNKKYIARSGNPKLIHKQNNVTNRRLNHGSIKPYILTQ
jgi:DnaJ-class molecular chaperone